MKKEFVYYSVIMFLAAGICAQANMLVNPGFEDGPTGQMNNPIPGWNTWGTNGWHHDDAGKTIDTKACKLWWVDSGYYQDVPVIGGHTYTFSCHMAHFSDDPLRDDEGSPGTGDKRGILKAEWYDEFDGMLQEIIFAEITKDSPLDTYILFSEDFVAPPTAVVGRIVLTGTATNGGGSIEFDNASIYDKTLYGQAYDPDPDDDATVTLALDDLFWKNHDAKDPNETITCDVYLEAEGEVIDPNFYNPPIATGVTTGTVNLTAAGVTLADNTVYTWRVDSTDPNHGGPVLFPGAVWTFQVGDVAPVVDAGPNQYNWLSMDDGDGDPAKVTFTVTGTYTDDGNSAIARAEWVQGAHEGGGTVTIESQSEPTPGTVEAVVSATGNGWLFLTLEVEDAVGVGADTMNVGVYTTCMEAALEDPDDNTIETNWPNGQHGDINGDCKTDMEDFAILASSWIECMTVKAGCTP